MARRARRERHEDDELQRAVDGVLDGDDARAPHGREHLVLQDEDHPENDREDVAERERDVAREERELRRDAGRAEDEQQPEQRDRQRGDEVHRGDRPARAATHLRQETHDRGAEVELPDEGQALHREDEGGVAPDRLRRVQPRRGHPERDPQCGGHDRARHQRVRVAVQRIAQVLPRVADEGRRVHAVRVVPTSLLRT